MHKRHHGSHHDTGSLDVFDGRAWHARSDGDHGHHAVSSGPQPEGIVTVLGGTALAAGDASTATGFIENAAYDRGWLSIAKGEAIFEASAHTAEQGGAVAMADTFLDISGADFIIEREVDRSGHGQYDAWARSELDYLAIDIHGWSPPNGPVVIDINHGFGHGHGAALGHDAAYGAFAQMLATAEAHGANTLSATLTSAITVENHFSFVTGMGIVAI
jgi:hypothetical protein